MQIDFGKTASDYGRYRAGFPNELFERLASFNIGQSGQEILDLGTGTGTLARSFALQGCHVTGIDKAAPLMEEAKRLDAEAGVSVHYLEGTAEATELPENSFDVVSAGQCWHWFDRPQVAQEVKRLLVSGGTILIAHFDWIPLPHNVVDATEKLIQRHNPKWSFGGGTGMYPAWLADVAIAGFQNIETFTFDLNIPYSHEAWRGRIRASAGISASLSPEAVAQFDAEHQELLATQFPDDPLSVPHRTFALIATKP